MANGCKKEIEGVIAKVNKETITLDEYNSELDVNRKIYLKQYGEGFLSQVGPNGETVEESLKQQILDKLIVEELISQNAKEKDISVSEKEIEDKLKEIEASLGGEEKYKEFLTNNEISEEYFKENTRKEILMGKYYENYLENSGINEEDVEKFFEENKRDLIVLRAKHILVNNEDDAKNILERLKSGEEFEEVALLESLDSGSAAQGGDLGYFTRGTMIKEFEDAAFGLNVGEISDLVKTDVGYHIIKLEDKKETLKDLEEQISMILKQQNYEDHIEELKNKANIEVLVEVKDLGNEGKTSEKEGPKETETKKEDKK